MDEVKITIYREYIKNKCKYTVNINFQVRPKGTFHSYIAMCTVNKVDIVVTLYLSNHALPIFFTSFYYLSVDFTLASALASSLAASRSLVRPLIWFSIILATFLASSSVRSIPATIRWLEVCLKDR